jgi:hypothetical protein
MMRMTMMRMTMMRMTMMRMTMMMMKHAPMREDSPWQDVAADAEDDSENKSLHQAHER